MPNTSAPVIRRQINMDEIEVRADDAAVGTLEGYASLFGVRADLGWFTEEIKPGAFAASITTDDQRALFNHDTGLVLGRRSAGTLRLLEDSRGLQFEIDLPDTQVARDLAVSVGRGDIREMSFGFRVKVDRWDASGDIEHRTIEEVELLEISPVTFPAYTETSVGLRSADQVEAEASLVAFRDHLAIPARQIRRSMKSRLIGSLGA